MSVISMKALLETGVHFGHRTRRWNPRMKPYIFTERNGIHIIDLQQTIVALEQAYGLVRDTAARGGTVLFVGTKRQAQETMQKEAERAGMPSVTNRWLGGTLTNWRTINARISYLKELERRRDAGELERLVKKEAAMLNQDIARLNERLGGLKNMKRLPELLFIVDVRREVTAVHEANILNIPIIAMVDTNCDPTNIDHVIPSNDDAIRAIKLIVAKMADAAIEGKAQRKEEVEEEELEAEGRTIEELVEARRTAGEEIPGLEGETDEAFLGEATLAKMRSGELQFDETPKQP